MEFTGERFLCKVEPIRACFWEKLPADDRYSVFRHEQLHSAMK